MGPFDHLGVADRTDPQHVIGMIFEVAGVVLSDRVQGVDRGAGVCMFELGTDGGSATIRTWWQQVLSTGGGFLRFFLVMVCLQKWDR